MVSGCVERVEHLDRESDDERHQQQPLRLERNVFELAEGRDTHECTSEQRYPFGSGDVEPLVD